MVSVEPVQVQFLLVFEEELVEDGGVGELELGNGVFDHLRVLGLEVDLGVVELHHLGVSQLVLVLELGEGLALVGSATDLIDLVVDVVEGLLDVQTQLPEFTLHPLVRLESLFSP